MKPSTSTSLSPLDGYRSAAELPRGQAVLDVLRRRVFSRVDTSVNAMVVVPGGVRGFRIVTETAGEVKLDIFAVN